MLVVKHKMQQGFIFPYCQKYSRNRLRIDLDLNISWLPDRSLN
ncbi:hypothetical protein N0824_02329 [Microcystis sp. 0824]|nr:hypothetical protein N0824_02329 [Microcystis sp. 0824]